MIRYQLKTETMHPALREPTPVYEFEVKFPFEQLALKIGGRLDRLYGTAAIIVGRRTWRIGEIQAASEAPNAPTLLIRKTTALHRKLCTAIDRRFRREIDDLANQALEDRGGYMAVFGERLPADSGMRGLDRHGRAAVCTFQL